MVEIDINLVVRKEQFNDTSVAILPPVELTGVAWDKIAQLDSIMHGLMDSITSHAPKWKQFIGSNDYLTNQSCVCQ